MLWDKEFNQEGAIFIDFLKDVGKYFPQVQYSSIKYKNNKVAAELTQKGNLEFLHKNYVAALNYYDKSLCFAEFDSENMYIAFGNRCACFFSMELYSKCLTDIKLAINAKCNDQFIRYLVDCATHCIERMETHQPIKVTSPELSFEEDDRYLGMASCIDIKYNERFGRHIKAKCDIDVGNIILIEDPFVSTSYDTERKFCLHCLKQVTNLIPCNGCTFAMYCDNTCFERDIFHQTECGIFDDSCSIGQIRQHLQRSIITAMSIFSTVEDLMEFVDMALKYKFKKSSLPIFDIQSKYYAFLQLHIHWSFKRASLFLKVVYLTFKMFPFSLKAKFNTERKRRFLMHLIGQHYCILITNGFFDGKNRFNYIILSYFNHSCSPNVINCLHRGKIICIVARPIKKNEQLFICYKWDKSAEIRRNEMLENWGLNCECEKCEPSYETIAVDESLLPWMAADCDILLNVIRNDAYKFDKTKLMIVKEFCINYLRKYGSIHWNDKMELVIRYFLEVLHLEWTWPSDD